MQFVPRIALLTIHAVVLLSSTLSVFSFSLSLSSGSFQTPVRLRLHRDPALIERWPSLAQTQSPMSLQGRGKAATTLNCASESRHSLTPGYDNSNKGRKDIESDKTPATKEAESDAVSERGRRQFLGKVAGVFCGTTLDLMMEKAEASASTFFPGREDSVVLPLFYCGGSYCMTFNIDSHGPFRAVVDTGSPFFTVAGSCTKRWGCFAGEGRESALKPTWEVFAAKEGIVKWREGVVSFPNATGSAAPALGAVKGVRGGIPLTFGVLSNSLVARPGGVFLGLVRERELDIRPTFLGQTDFVSLRIDLADRARKTLTLSRTPLLPASSATLPAAPLVDLRPFGDPVQHYACVASEVLSNGRRLETGGKRLYVIFDTGTTGFTMSRDLYEEELSATANRPRTKADSHPWADVRVRIRAVDGSTLEVAAADPITTPVDVPWPAFDAHLLIVGLSFLEGTVLTIDSESRMLSVDQTRRAQSAPAGFDPSDCFASKRGVQCTMEL